VQCTRMYTTLLYHTVLQFIHFMLTQCNTIQYNQSS
jgi:hypothetical protein